MYTKTWQWIVLCFFSFFLTLLVLPSSLVAECIQGKIIGVTEENVLILEDCNNNQYPVVIYGLDIDNKNAATVNALLQSQIGREVACFSRRTYSKNSHHICFKNGGSLQQQLLQLRLARVKGTECADFLCSHWQKVQASAQ